MIPVEKDGHPNKMFFEAVPPLRSMSILQTKRRADQKGTVHERNQSFPRPVYMAEKRERDVFQTGYEYVK